MSTTWKRLHHSEAGNTEPKESKKILNDRIGYSHFFYHSANRTALRASVLSSPKCKDDVINSYDKQSSMREIDNYRASMKTGAHTAAIPTSKATLTDVTKLTDGGRPTGPRCASSSVA